MRWLFILVICAVASGQAPKAGSVVSSSSSGGGGTTIPAASQYTIIGPSYVVVNTTVTYTLIPNGLWTGTYSGMVDGTFTSTFVFSNLTWAADSQIRTFTYTQTVPGVYTITGVMSPSLGTDPTFKVTVSGTGGAATLGANTFTGNQTIGTALPAGAPAGTIGASVIYSPNGALNVKAFGATGNAKLVTDAVSNGTTTVTSATAAFVAGDVGKVIWGVETASGLARVPKGTITAVGSSTSITVSVTATGSYTGLSLVFGTDDSTALIAAVAAATTLHLPLYHPSGGYIFSKLIYDYRSIGGGLTPSILGDGSTATVFYPTPDYDFSTTATNFGMLNAYAGGSGTLSGFGINAAGHLFATDHANNWLLDLSGTLRVSDVTVQNLGGHVQYCINAIGGHVQGDRIKALACNTFGSFGAGGMNFNAGGYIISNSSGSNGQNNVTVQNIAGSANQGDYFYWIDGLNDEGSGTPFRVIASTDVNFIQCKLFTQASTSYTLDIDGTSVVRMNQCAVGPFNTNNNSGAIRVQSGGVLYMGATRVYSSGTGVALQNSGTVYDLGGNTITNVSGTNPVPLFLATSVTGTGAVVLATAPTISAPVISGHPTIEGVTPTGATGTGAMVFGTSPSIAPANLTWNGTVQIADAANTVALRNSTNNQTLYTYQTYTDASNYRRTAHGSDGKVSYQCAGTGCAANTFSIENQINNGNIALNASGSGVVTAGSPFNALTVQVTQDATHPLQIHKTTQSAAAPGANYCDLRWEAGTSAGTGKLVAYCGTSATGVTIIDNVGASF